MTRLASNFRIFQNTSEYSSVLYDILYALSNIAFLYKFQCVIEYFIILENIWRHIKTFLITLGYLKVFQGNAMYSGYLAYSRMFQDTSEYLKVI